MLIRWPRGWLATTKRVHVSVCAFILKARHVPISVECLFLTTLLHGSAGAAAVRRVVGDPGADTSAQVWPGADLGAAAGLLHKAGGCRLTPG
jgi:hypothetical protein